MKGVEGRQAEYRIGRVMIIEAVLERMTAAADNAARYIRGRARETETLAWESKSPADFVSEVDRRAEELIRELLAGEPLWVRGEPVDLPTRIVAEEGSPDLAHLADGLTYVVDPLDGTTNFLHDYP